MDGKDGSLQISILHMLCEEGVHIALTQAILERILKESNIGTQAVMNVINGERYKVCTKECKDILAGQYGQTVKPFNEEVVKKAIGDRERITCRPADLIPNELDKIEAEMKEWKQQDEDVLTYALFPKVALDFFKYRKAQQDKVDLSKADTENGAYPA